MNNIIGKIIIAIAILGTAIILSTTYKNRNRTNDIINVTGLGKKDFTSDLIVWNGSFTRKKLELKQVYQELNNDRDAIRGYLVSKGVNKNELVFSSVDIDKEYEYSYDRDRNSYKTFSGYRLTQSVQIESKKVEKIESISREITELINIGIEFYSRAPQYYYTKLSELKIEMIATATEDARIRGEQIAGNANAEIGTLRYAKMGVFQIIAQNSNENYSWGGSFNTSAKRKTATITMKLQFGIN